MVDIAFCTRQNSSWSELSHKFVDKSVSLVNLMFDNIKTSKQFVWEEISKLLVY